MSTNVYKCGLTRSSETKLETTKLFAVAQVASNVQNAAEPFTAPLSGEYPLSGEGFLSEKNQQMADQ